jgi:hypothetical protein
MLRDIDDEIVVAIGLDIEVELFSAGAHDLINRDLRVDLDLFPDCG